MTRLVSALLLLLAGLLAGSPAKADVWRDSFQDELLSYCYDDGLIVLNETPDTARAASTVGASLGDEMGDGTVDRPSLAVPSVVVWTRSVTVPRYGAPGISHPPCAEPSTGPPAA